MFNDESIRSDLDASRSTVHNSVTIQKIARANEARIAPTDAKFFKLFYPFQLWYKRWWKILVILAGFGAFFETYEVAFRKAGLYPYSDASSIIDYILTAVFVSDIAVNFNLACFDENNKLVTNRSEITRRYLKLWFWIDLVGVFPFYEFALAVTGTFGEDSKLTQCLAILRLLRLIRLHRVAYVVENMKYSSISFQHSIFVRNFLVMAVWMHFSACVFYFIAKQYRFDPDNTWIGDSYQSNPYITSLYWSTTSFTTVGYGDWSPVNAAEQIWGMLYMITNVVIGSWIIGSITLMIIKADEKRGNFRSAVEALDEFARLNSLPTSFVQPLKTQLKVDFENQDVSDERVFQYFPSSVRKNILRRLYLPSSSLDSTDLEESSLMNGVRAHFVDEFLTSCRVEVFGPGEEVLERSSISSHLYFLMEGSVTLGRLGSGSTELTPGEFINHFGFFTESPEIETVTTNTICKMLSMSRSAYKVIAEDHPGSVQKILENLLDTSHTLVTNLPQSLERIRVGSLYFDDDPPPNDAPTEIQYAQEDEKTESYVVKIQELVKMHISKQKDDRTNKFLFAASRGDLRVVSIMLDQGFDPNSADYDFRTALMVSAVKGNNEIVKRLLEYDANPNLVDWNGSSALYEAVRHGHDDTIDILLKAGAQLCIEESIVSSMLCQTIYDGNMSRLKKLLKAKINVDAVDYDKRAAVHIAAAEGNLPALKLLVEHGAKVNVLDRWKRTPLDEANAANLNTVHEFLKTLV